MLYQDEIDAVNAALTKLQDKFAEAPKDDWRASLGWEGVERVSHDFGQAMFDTFECPRKPEKFRHWSEVYKNELPWEEVTK